MIPTLNKKATDNTRSQIWAVLGKQAHSPTPLSRVGTITLQKKQSSPRPLPSHRPPQEQHSRANPTQKSLLSQALSMSLVGLGLFLNIYLITNAESLTSLWRERFASAFYSELVAEQSDALSSLSVSSSTRSSSQPLPPQLPVAGALSSSALRLDIGSLDTSVMPPDNRIVIPSIQKNIPVVTVSDQNLLAENWSGLNEDIQEGLQDGVVHYPGTADPGEIGNVFITGHSSYYLWDPGDFKDVFALLHDLEVGDEFTLFWEEKPYTYRIQERSVVPPTQTEVLSQPADRRIATLMTCTPIGTANDRLILVAEQL